MPTKTPAKAAGAKRKPAAKGKAPKSDSKAGELERQLQEAKAALQERSAQLEAAQAELAAMREKAPAAEAPAASAEAGKIRCPRCSGPMTEYDHTVVRADRCDNCQGIFFDNGELEQVIEKALKDHDGSKPGGWFSSLFGKREAAKPT